MKKVQCPKCKWEWIPRKEKPKQCPLCKRYLIKPTKGRKGSVMPKKGTI